MNSLQQFSIRKRIIGHPAYKEATARVERLHQRALDTGQAGGLLITGLSGAGKTTVKNQYLRRFWVVDKGDILEIPVLSVETPAAPTVKNLAEAMLIALDDPMSHLGSAEQKTQRIYHFLKRCKVQFLLIDEFQHFFEHGRRNEVRRVTDWLKSLINNAAIPVALFGLPECEQVLQLNGQLARRFSSRYYLRPFGFESEEQILEFRGVLDAVEKLLPLPSASLSSMDMAQRFYYATYGLIDYVCKVTDGAIQLAYQSQCKKLDVHLYAKAFEEEVWRDVPDGLNPFTANDELRPLIRPGEPFSDVHQSTLKKRNWNDSKRRGK